MPTIRSRQHRLVPRCRALARAPGDEVLLDGVHLLREALASHVALEVVIVTEARLDDPEVDALRRRLPSGTELQPVAEAVMDAMSPTRTPSGVLAIGRPRPWTLADVFAPAPALAVLAVDVQDPGNVGAVIRSADAAGATGVAACGASAHPWGWKALRGSMGSAFRVPAVRVGVDEALDAARAAGAAVLATVPSGGAPMTEADFSRPAALLLGGEGPGLPESLVAAADARVSIPMRPPVESLNVAVAAALLLYEARRQRAR